MGLMKLHYHLNFLLILLSTQFSYLTGHQLFDFNGVGRLVDHVQNGETFDFIVAGGGTAGCAVAARLAESGEHSVLLIEAGGLPHPDLSIPALSLKHLSNRNISRVYRSVPQVGAVLDQNGIGGFLTGHMLGGTSGLNGQVLNRGSPHDYNNWARLTGDPSWSYGNMLKYFRKSENYMGLYPSPQRGFQGPVTITRQRYAPGLAEWFQAGQELGYGIAEPNGPQMISFTPVDFTRTRDGRRVSSYTAYIKPMLEKTTSPPRKSNLLILINTEVNRVIFEGNRAVGVTFTSNNSTNISMFAKAKKEVIVSAGIMNSPALLLRSGIGPKSVLDGAGISPVKFLPVGQHLQDQAVATIVVALGSRSAAFDEDNDLTPAAWEEFQLFGDGPYTSIMGEAVQAFVGSSALPPGERYMGWPDLHLIPSFSNVRTALWDRDQVTDLREGEIAMPWGSWVVRPKSRGTVTLNPENANGAPLIDFQLLTNPYDIKVMADGLKRLAKICEETVAFQNIGCRVIEDKLPACNHTEYRSDKFWECYGRQRSRFGHHAGGTCRMGSGPDYPEAVVDPKLRVVGIEGLRVVDASIMPAVNNANTQAPVYAIAEKAADMILEKWNRGNLPS